MGDDADAPASWPRPWSVRARFPERKSRLLTVGEKSIGSGEALDCTAAAASTADCEAVSG